MRLALKLILLVVTSVVGLMVLDGYLAVRREVALFDRDFTRDAGRLGRALGTLLAEVSREQGQERAQELLREAAAAEGPDLRIEWIDLPAEDEREGSSATSAEEGRGRSAASETDLKNEGLASVDTPLPLVGRRAVLRVSESVANRDAYVRTTMVKTSALTLAVALAAVVAVCISGSLLIGRPVNRLVEKARRVGRGDLSGALPVHGRDELGELAAALNEMCAQLETARCKLLEETESRIQAYEELRHVDRLRTVGRLASGLAHELGTPLNVVMGHATLIRSGGFEPGEIAQSATIIHEQGQRMTSIIRQLLAFARRSPSPKERLDLRDVVQRTVEMLDSTVGRRDSTVAFQPPEDPIWIRGSESQLEQVLSNLILNAIHSMPEGGRVDLTIAPERARPPGVREESELYRVDVRDSGSGIHSDDLPQIFEPFFTTKPAGQGTGLGLAIAYGIVQEHGGWIDVASELGRGSCFSVHLPREEA